MVTPRSDAGGNDGWTPTNRPPSRTSATACSWSTAASATVSQPRGRLGGEVGAEAAHELLVRGAGQPGDPPAALERERDDVPADGAGGAGHEQGAALAVAEDVDELERGERVERDGGRLDQVEVVRYDGHVGGRQHQLLGVGAEVAVEPADQAGDAGPRRQVDARAGLENGAGEVPAEAGVLRLVDDARPVQPAAPDEDVDRVDGRGRHGDPDLAGLEGRDREVEERDRVGLAGLGDDGGAEGGCWSWFLHRCCGLLSPAGTIRVTEALPIGEQAPESA